MKLLILSAVAASLDGMRTRDLEADEILEINEEHPREVDLADSLTRAGFAELVTDEQAAAHRAELEKLTPEEREERKSSRLEAERAAAEADRQAKLAAALGKPAPSPASKPAKPPKAPKAKPEGAVLELAVGDVVAIKGEPATETMTVTKIEPSEAGPQVTCTWFEADNSGPFTEVFKPADLIKVK